MRVLLLGGTAEARELAGLLHPRVEVVSSLAGRVPDPALPVGAVRIGGFGGVAGLRDWLSCNGIDAVIDATHPFAATITANAAAAAAAVGLPHLVLQRPAWNADDAIAVDSDHAAAEAVAAQSFSRIFLTTGRSGAAAFRRSAAWFLIRVVTAPDESDLPARRQLIFSRGPYRYADETALLARHRIDALVTKNSGGELTRAKLDAARDLGVAVVMIGRPALPAGVRTVSTVDDAREWVLSRDSGAA